MRLRHLQRSSLIARLAMALLISVITISLTGRGPASAQSPEIAPNDIVAASPGSIYWGAWIGEQLTGTAAPWDKRAIWRFERLVGKRLSLVHFAVPFAGCARHPCHFFGFPTREIEKIRRHGAIPFLSWSSASIPVRVRERGFQLRDVAGGRF